MAPQLTPTSTTGGSCSSSSNQCAGCAGGSGRDNSQEPVRYFNGQVKLVIQDLLAGGFGRAIGHTRFFTNQLSDGSSETSHDFHNGFNWMVREWCHLVDVNGDESEILVQMTPENVAQFIDNSGFEVQHGRYETLETATDIYKFTQADGTVYEFHDFTQSAKPKGSLKRIVNPNGEEITFDYNASGTCKECVRSYTEGGGSSGSTTQTEELIYTYDANDRLTKVTLRRKTGTGAWSSDDELRRVSYEYYGTSDSHGNDGDLKLVKEEIPDGAGGWTEIKRHYFRYYKDSAGGTGFQHGLKFYVGPEAYSRITNPLTAADSVIDDYADKYFEYDSNQRVTKEVVDGGNRTFTFAYTNSAHSDGYNNWKRKTVETLPDNNQNIVYTNYIGQVMLQEFKSGSDSWVEYFKYDADGRLIERANPSAVTSYNDTQANLGLSLKSSSGVMYLTEYASSTSGTISETVAGDVEGRVKTRKIRNGSSGTSVKLRDYKYFKRTNSGRTVYPMAEDTVYTSDASGGSSPVTTKWSYTWQSGTVQIDQRTTKLPAVAASQNGENVVDEQVDVFDELGYLRWNEGARGFIRYLEYDNFTGALIKRIEDVDTAETADFEDLPSGWSTPSGGGLHLIHDFEVDGQGRVTQELGPEHSIDIGGTATNIRRATWTVYDEENTTVRVGHGYQKTSDSSFTLIEPVTITIMDDAGRVVEEVSSLRDPEESGKLSASESFSQADYVRWTKHTFSDKNQLTGTKVYHTIPTSGDGSSGTNYDETLFGYDDMDRLDREESPGGTITRTVFDDRGRQESIWIGTDDEPTSGEWSPTNNSGANMTKITEYQYDANADGGDDNLTKITQHVDSSTTRVTTNGFDWRNRLESIDGEVDFYELRYYDNLNRVTKVERKDTTSTGNLVSRSETKFDDRGRIYQRIRHEVDPSTGTVGNKLTDNMWYDCCGNIIKQHPGGSEAFTKMVYDGVARMTKQYLGYDVSESTYAEADDVVGDTVFEQVEMDYDAGDNLIEVTRLRRYHDDSGTGALVAGSDSRPDYTASWHDALGRVVSTAQYGNQGNDSTSFTRPSTIPASSDTVLVTKTELNADGEAFKLTDPAGKEDRVEFDDAGRRTKTIENYTDGDPTSGGDDEDVTVEFSYNADGLLETLTAKQDSSNDDQVTTYVYGTDKGGITPEVYRNDLVRAVIYPDSDDVADPLGDGSDSTYDRIEYEYNRQGEITKMKDQNGNVHQYDYDKLGRQTQDRVTTVGSGVHASVRRLETAFDVRGLLERSTSFSSATVGSGSKLTEVVREYNDLGLLDREYQEHEVGGKDANTLYVEYNYDDSASGGELTKGYRLKSIRYPDARLVHFQYGTGDGDKLNRLDAIADYADGGTPGTKFASYEYLGSETVVEIDYEEPDVKLDLIGSGNSYSGFDRFGRITDQKWHDYGASADVDRYKYGYDRASNRTYRENTLTSGKDEFYTYDEMHRLKNFDRGDLNAGKTAISGTPVREQDWTLDPLGNWDTFTDKSSGTTSLLQSRTHNKVNEITDLSRLIGTDWADPAHDKNGNMTTVPQPADPANSYSLTWDAWNRLMEVEDDNTSNTVARYVYDSLHRRMKKLTYSGGTLSETRFFFYTSVFQCIEERVDSDVESQYIWGLRYIDELILRDRDASSSASGLEERLYALQDGNWNVTALVDDTGDCQERNSYTPFGEVSVMTPSWGTRSSSSFANPYTYTGRRFDSETGLYHFRHRDYHAQLGRFLSRDPIGYADGFNLYAGYFVPNGVDPFGYQTWELVSPHAWWNHGARIANNRYPIDIGVDLRKQFDRDQQRLDYLQSLLEELIILGDQHYPNADEWAVLRDHMEYATRFDDIPNEVTIVNMSSKNFLGWRPIALDRDTFSKVGSNEDKSALELLIHEPMHDLSREGPSLFTHEITWFNGVSVNDVVGPYSTENYFQTLFETLFRQKLWREAREAARRRLESGSRDPALSEPLTLDDLAREGLRSTNWNPDSACGSTRR